MSLALWLLIYLGILYAVGRLYVLTLGWKGVSYAFYPGMLVAAAGRVLACLAGQQVRGKVDLMRSDGPSGSRNLPGGHGFRFLYAVGPFVATLIAFTLADAFLQHPIQFSMRLPRLALDVNAVGQSANTLGDFLSAILASFSDQKLGDWRWWAFLYLGFALVVTTAPHRNDLVSVAGFCAVVGLVGFVLDQAGIDVIADRVYGGTFWGAFSVLVALGLLVLLVSAVVLLPMMILRRSNKES
jgi:hypothetical protein